MINNGEAIRDFIHVDEVCELYLKLINQKNKLIVDVGKGFGFRIKDIINSIGQKNFIIKRKNKFEQNISIASKRFKLKKNYKLSSYLAKSIGKGSIRKNIRQKN